MRILRPQPATPQQPPVTRRPAAEPPLPCRVRLADGRVFRGALAPVRHRALQLGLLHAATRELVELTPGTRRPDGRLEIDRRRRRALPARRRERHPRLAGRPARARRADRRRRLHAASGSPDGLREEAFVGVAPRTRARGGKDAVAATRFLWIDIDRPERAGRAVGAAGRAALPPADRVRRLGRRARLLEARRAAAGDAREPGQRRARGADRARERADHPPPRRRRRRAPDRRRPAVPRARARDAPGRHDQPQDRRLRTRDRRRPAAPRLPARAARRRPARPRADRIAPGRVAIGGAR